MKKESKDKSEKGKAVQQATESPVQVCVGSSVG